ncbi:uncharacterized protein FOMMEDRAFT_143582 [Fomitiporia mediterranea MF3/22]|uniref:uncharacterized protein n=1 Tax=Fomitiporia mediterranea (strain MF3/22) TaxID=694068 RepID=UPI000440983A|nr:uncharacterized protein FOMMEDRAFT_143582 [Fomitiporia mediterranea MF3/22]EJC98149.1 hypothetical protein FOMMEDRAFT_143582 [Fomitiporia mediterranea MF3/22]
MSGTHTPASDDSNGSRTRLTRTVAIIKNHALKHRMDIEERIQKADFEIVKERQMEFDQNSDQEFLRELFGIDTPSLFEGPVWVYVLERRRAVEVFKALMGEEDPVRAREASPNSLRALFGEEDPAQNAVAGSPDAETAEVQIQCLFQSSPPFSTQDPDELEGVNNIQHELGSGPATENGTTASDDWQTREHMLSPTSSQISQSANLSGSNGIRRPTLTSSVSGASSGRGSLDGKVPFRARPLPKTHDAPDIAPRTTRAAALRAGEVLSTSRYDRPRVAPTKEELKQAFMDVPGHKRSTTIQVASTAPPVIAPRMTKAAALRLGGGKAAPPLSSSQKLRSSNANTFEGVPGHKRRETIQVASVQAPTVSPRLNKSAELRAKKDSAPPTSFMFKGPSTPKAPGSLSRTNSQTTLTNSRPGSALSRSSSSLANRSQASTAGGRNYASLGRSTSQKPSAGSAVANGKNENKEESPVRSPPPRPPSIEPRTNRSALLRAKVKGPTPPVKTVPVVNRRASMIV